MFYDKITINNNEFQVSAIRIQLENQKYILCNVYNQPSKNYDFDNLQTIFNNFHEPMIVLGDFNAHNPIWDCNTVTSDQAGNLIENLMNVNNLCCLNDNETSTYFSKTHSTMSSVDISLCTDNIVDQFEWAVCDELYSSDHFPIIISYLHRNHEEHIPHYNINKADWEMFEFYTRHINPFENLQDHDETNDYLTEFIKNAADKSIPRTTPLTTKNKVPWWSDELSALVKQKHSVGRRLDTLNRRFRKINKRQHLNESNLQKMVILLIEIDTLKPIYNKLSAKFRKEVIQGRIISWKQYVSNISSHTPIQKIWQKFRKINGNFIHSPRHAIIKNGNKILDSREISNLLGQNFANISSTNNLNDHFQRIKRRAEINVINFETVQDIYYNRKFSMEELIHALSFCNNSAPGRDEMCFEMIKRLSPSAKSYLLQFYNHLWVRNLFPKKWCHAIIIPFSKPGKDPSNVNNYRPISLTSCLCKVLEKMVNARLTWYLRKNKILSPTQFGSQKNRSTLDSLSHIEDHIRRGFERKQITAAIFFDIQKAYDTTWRHNILKNLYDNDLRGHLPIFIKNFISDRTFQVRIDNIHSDIYRLENGVPQGSVLSGTLFTLAINDITNQLPIGIKNNLYMDDFAIYYTASSMRHADRILNTAIRKIDNWATSVGFQFSIEKTQAILFYKDVRWTRHEEIELKIKDHLIPISQTVKFLGLVFDTHLNWKAHVAYIKGKCKNALNLMKKLSHTTWGADRSTLMMIYKATVLSILDYGCQIYGSASEATLKILDPIHNEGLRLCSGAFRSSPCNSLQVESGELPLNLHRDLITIRSAVRIQASDSPTKALFEQRDIFINNHTPSFPIRASRLLEDMNIEINIPQTVNLPPPWLMHEIKICTELNYLTKKSNDTTDHYKQHTLQHISKKPPHYAIYTDGSKSSTGVGYAAISVDEKIQFSLPKTATIFTAELCAILDAIKFARKLPSQKFIIYTDSKSSIEALKNFNPKNSLVQEIKYTLHKHYEAGRNIELCWIPSHVGVKGNEDADRAAKAATTMTQSNIKIPINDYMPMIKSSLMNKWQISWDNENINKLKEIKPNVGFWQTSLQKERHMSVILSRLRIGHTKFTHGYLMNTPHDPIPTCRECNTIVTVKHILCDCQNFNQQRQITFGNKTLEEILSESPNFSIYPIIKFLKKCNLLDKI